MSAKWTETARAQLAEYAEFIERASMAAADRWVAKMLAAAELAARFPLMGHAVPDFDDENVQQVIVYSHRLIYRIAGKDIEILRVWHGSRLLRAEDIDDE